MTANTKTLTSVLVVLALIGLASTASAVPVVITFDEFAADNANGPMPANRYSSLGVTFSASDDGTTWGGLSNGDPGNWDLEGTNGPIFSGFNGSSYGLTMLFNAPVTSFSLDASRSNGSSAGNTLLVQGFLGATLVDSVNLTFGPINSWSTFSLIGIVDRVVWAGAGSGFHPFGVDNITWNTSTGVPEPGTLLLIGAGLMGMGFTKRRRSS